MSFKKVALIALTVACFLTIESSTSYADQVGLKVGVANPMMLAGKKDTNYIRVTLSGFELPETKDRPPVNVAIVIDTSGSMNGKKIAQARKAAVAAVKRLRDDDIVSVLLYSNSVRVLVPSTKATDRNSIIKKIQSVKAKGGTALFAGVSKGAAEVRKFLAEDYVNRVILLSDGRANVGPQTPRELERLGMSLLKEGISVSTLGLGLGYNEDLMTRLASAASGNHIFVEQADNLIAVFNDEFNDLMSVVAGDIGIKARVADGVRPVRVIGTTADISGQEIYIPLAQLYASQERYFVLEVEVDANKTGTEKPLIHVEAVYQNMISETHEKLAASINLKFSDSTAEVEKNRDYETYAYCTVQLANERNELATALRDAGQIDEARKLLRFNIEELTQCASSCQENLVTDVLPELELNVRINGSHSELIEQNDWNRNRKIMRESQSEVKSQSPSSRSGSILQSILGRGSRSLKSPEAKSSQVR